MKTLVEFLDACSRQRPKRIILAIFIGAIIVRMLVLYAFPNVHLGSNARIAFIGGAEKILHGEGFRDPTYPMFIPPLTAIYVAGHFGLFGERLIPIKVTQCILDAGTVVLTCLSVTAALGWIVGLMTALVLVFYPFTIFASIYIGSETLFTFLLSLSIFFAIGAIQRSRMPFFILLGLSLGFATLTRGTTFYFPIFLIIVLWAFDKHLNKRKLLGWGLMFIAFASVIAPWTLRNYLVLDSFVPVSTHGAPLLQGSSERFFTIAQKEKEFPKYFRELEERGIIEPINEQGWTEKREIRFRKAAWENYKKRMLENPGGLIIFMLKKFGRLWYATESGENHSVILLSNFWIYLLAGFGIIAVFIEKKPLSLLFGAVIFYFCMIYCVSLPLFRYMIPVMPYVISFAMFAILLLWKRVKKRNNQYGIIPAGV